MNTPNQKENRISAHFTSNWELYQRAVQNDFLCHSDMFSTLKQFLRDTFKKESFSLADFGCGDSSAIRDTLIHQPIKKYIGIDSAEELLTFAPKILNDVVCDKIFICENMSIAIQDLSLVDIIFSSYALHHLSYADKVTFIQNCYEKLNSNGHFLLVDVVLPETQNREEWLSRLEKRHYEVFPDMTPQEVEICLEHPRRDDFPEAIETYHSIAKMQPWQKFKVLVDKEIFAFMVFSK